MTIAQAAFAWHVAANTVSWYCLKGRIPGAKLIPSGQKSRKIWFIPDDAQKPAAYPKGGNMSGRGIYDLSSCQSRDNVDYVWKKQGSKSIGQLARELNVSCERIVELYEMGFKRYLHKGE